MTEYWAITRRKAIRVAFFLMFLSFAVGISVGMLAAIAFF